MSEILTVEVDFENGDALLRNRHGEVYLAQLLPQTAEEIANAFNERAALRQRAEAAEAEADDFRVALDRLQGASTSAYYGALQDARALLDRWTFHGGHRAFAEVAAARREVCTVAATQTRAADEWWDHLNTCGLCSAGIAQTPVVECATGGALRRRWLATQGDTRTALRTLAKAESAERG